jgi:TonB-dependent receptor
MLLRSALLGGVSTLAVGALATPGLAQASDQSVETVVVTGIIGSLQRDMDIKRDANGIVDAITAEDIGKFPDVDLADAMMRIPGVTVTRGVSSLASTGSTTTTGEATEITVRGFGPTFNETLFDGRQVATGTGNRAFDFSSVVPDFVNSIEVLKSPDSTLSSGAIGATVNVKFPKPFDYPGLTLAGSISGNISPEDGQLGPSGDVLISDTFAGDTFGILLDASYSDTRTREDHINNQGWEGTTGGFAGGVDAGTPAWYIQDFGIYNEHSNVERMQGRFVLQWRPNDAFEVTVNDDFSRDHNAETQHGYSVWFNPGSLQNVQTDSNGTVTNFVQPSTPTDFQGQYNSEILQFNDFGANVKWHATESFSVIIDADHEDAWLNPGGELTYADSDVGYGNAMDNASVGITLPGAHGLPYTSNYGPNNNKAQFINNGIIGSHVFPLGSSRNLDTINQVKAEGDWESDAVSLKFGLQYVAEHKNQQELDDFENNNWQAYSGYGPASGNTAGVTLPQSFFTQSFSTKNFINGWTGSNNLPPAILAYSPFTILNYLNSLNGVGANNCCAPPPNEPGRPFSGTYQIALSPSSVEDLSEDTFSGYLESTIKTQIDGLPLKVNVGARYDITQENVTGLGRTVSAFQQQTGDATAWNVIYSGGSTTPVSATHQYQYLLPNFDLDLSVTDTLDVRFDASRTLTRPPIGSLGPVISIGASRVGDVTANGGNPNLLPFLSDNVDLGAQWYYQANSYLSIDTFLKSVDNFIINSSNSADFGNIGTETVNPATKVAFPTPVTVDVPYTITQPSNGPAANVYGLEIAWQHVFGDSGYGFLINGTVVGSDHPYNPAPSNISGFAVTGLADSANLMAFYDKNGFQVRVAANWQDSYLDHFGQLQNGSAFGTEPTFVNGSWNLDLSTSYDITDEITVYAEGLNLTDATYSTHGRYSNQFLDIVDYGRKFIVGVHFKY